MKFLIENYANYFDTQALYLNKALSKHEGVETMLWNSASCSIYDIMDRYQPDYYITSANRLSKDFAHYVINNKKIKLLLNVDYINQQTVTTLEKSINESSIDCCFFFSSKYSIKTKNIRFVNLANAHDINVNDKPDSIKYDIDKAIFVSSTNNLNKYTGSYHYISNDDKLKNSLDIVLPSHMLAPLYKNYKEILFHNIEHDYIPQSFFDAIMLGNKVYCENITKETDEMLKKVFKLGDNSFDYNSTSKLEDFSQVRAFITEKHLPSNRAKTILSQIPKVGEEKNERRYSFA